MNNVAEISSFFLKFHFFQGLRNDAQSCADSSRLLDSGLKIILIIIILLSVRVYEINHYAEYTRGRKEGKGNSSVLCNVNNLDK